ncbi:MAG: anti-sigma factor [candidate division WOR-3 bacterium]|nr:anti-sigma factor [candidate division WOR-3 bacterium]
MLKHEEIERLIQKSLDHETTAEEERMLHLHLSDCPDCRELYFELTQFFEAMDERVEFFPSPDFNERVLIRLRRIGFRKSLVWARAAAVFAAGWLASFLFLVFSPWVREIITRAMVSTPAIVRFFDKVQVVVNTLRHILTPFAKNLCNPTMPVLGLILSIIIFYLFSRTLRKETKCTV